MNTMDPHRIRVARSGTGFVVTVGDEEHAVFTGKGAKDRAVGSALRLAEELRKTGPVVIVVDRDDGTGEASRVLRSRLAS